ncbi:MAG TPA: hypothetical protein EYO73_00550, partial [Sulfurimonas sp.]|nr:hypothetical protein [Sulfurimonas sp.]
MKITIFILVFLLTTHLNANLIESKNTYNLTSLQEEIDTSTLPVMIYFRADWCTICKEMEKKV